MKSQLTLGQLIAKLEALKPDEIVRFDFCGEIPTTFDSYRGIYAHLALGHQAPEHDVEPCMAKDLLVRCASAVGTIFTGWKGGEFKMHEDTPLWVANRG